MSTATVTTPNNHVNVLGPISPAQIAWHSAIRQVALNAQEKLPNCASRIAAAVKIVANGDVEIKDDGTASVRSQQGGKTTYHVANGGCSCPDYRKAFEGWCKHRIAHAIYRRAKALVTQKLHELEAPATETPPAAEPHMEHALPFSPPADACTPPPADHTAWMTGSSKTWKVTEAPLSTCLKLRIGVVEWTHTVRAQTDAELRTRLDDFRRLVAEQTEEFSTLALLLERKHQELRTLTATPPATTPPASSADPGRTPPPVTTPPTQVADPVKTPPANGTAESFCFLHGVDMMASKTGPGYFHKVGNGPDGKAIWCRGK
jgi:hypothetical protein